MIKYIGSKRVLIPTLMGVVESLPGVRSVVDLFSGTSRVGHALKRAGYQVRSNDYASYAHALATCYVQTDRAGVARDADRLIAEFNALPGRAGYFTDVFCEQSRFFQPHNGERVDAIREAIAGKGLEPELESVCLVSLMEAADRVDSTTGVQMAYLKRWAPRSFKPLEMRIPELLDRPEGGRCEAHCLEARAAAASLAGDLVYVDPPYNQHAYLGNYHVWESLVRWDKPDVYGVACKRIDCRDRKSDFNSKRRAEEAFRQTIDAIDSRYLMISFSSEGFLGRDIIEAALRLRGDVHVVERGHRRYIGSRIGVYNPAGERVGTTSHHTNTEFVYVVVPRGQAWEPADLQAGTSALPAA
ncbi:MAG: DNA adenine methylase [Planctomycetota bacterium]